MSEPESGGGLVRAFVAVPLPEDARRRVEAVQQRLRGSAGVKWVEPRNFHFTLRFLGYARADVLHALSLALSPSLAAEDAFSLTLAGVGAFPSARRPQAIWVGVADGKSWLEGLAGVVERTAAACGFAPEERPFRAHLTIGRVKAQRAPADLVEAIAVEEEGAEVARIRVSEVVLMRSELRRAGPIYTPIQVFPLASALE